MSASCPPAAIRTSFVPMGSDASEFGVNPRSATVLGAFDDS